ncbi:MAG: orotidine-5'-phosphate decarboxylase [Acidimicrobiales bacterium]
MTARDHLALALDVPSLDEGVDLARRLQEYFAVAKVGLELYSASGPAAVTALVEMGYRVFVDVKLYDIPNTVARASRVLGGLGASYVTVHTSGGLPMLRAAVEGLGEGAEQAGSGPSGPTMVLGVTVLTSDVSVEAAVFDQRVAMAVEAGCGGLVCAAAELARAHDLAPGLVRVVPGIRPAGVTSDDQARVATPPEALGAGADLLVIGRAVTAAPDPQAAAAAMVESIT